MANPKNRKKETVREHVIVTVRAIVSAHDEMEGRAFHFGIVPKDAVGDNEGLNMTEPGWGLVVAQFIQSLMTGYGYPRIGVAAAVSGSWSHPLSKGISNITDLIWKKLHPSPSR